jgi:TetR/AcrR family transcriptional repressor of uid operon
VRQPVSPSCRLVGVDARRVFDKYVEKQSVPKIVDPEKQRAEIRSAAWRVFSERGVKGTGLEHVARQMGVGRSSLYHYYPDKDSLVSDLTEELLREEERAFLAALKRAGGALERIDRLAEELTLVFSDWLAVGPMFLDLRHLGDDRFRRFYRKVRKLLADLIAEGRRSGEISLSLHSGIAAAAIIGMIDGLLLQYLIEPKAFADLARLREQVRVLIRRGLQA